MHNIFFNHDLGYTGMQVCMDLCICAFAYDVKQRCCYTSLILPCAVPSNIFDSPLFSIMLLKRYLYTPHLAHISEPGIHCSLKCIDLCGSLTSFSMQFSMSSPLQLSSHSDLIVRQAFALWTV